MYSSLSEIIPPQDVPELTYGPMLQINLCGISYTLGKRWLGASTLLAVGLRDGKPAHRHFPGGR